MARPKWISKKIYVNPEVPVVSGQLIELSGERATIFDESGHHWPIPYSFLAEKKEEELKLKSEPKPKRAKFDVYIERMWVTSDMRNRIKTHSNRLKCTESVLRRAAYELFLNCIETGRIEFKPVAIERNK
jgi:hypothetical protein